MSKKYRLIYNGEYLITSHYIHKKLNLKVLSRASMVYGQDVISFLRLQKEQYVKYSQSVGPNLKEYYQMVVANIETEIKNTGILEFPSSLQAKQFLVAMSNMQCSELNLFIQSEGDLDKIISKGKFKFKKFNTTKTAFKKEKTKTLPLLSEIFIEEVDV